MIRKYVGLLLSDTILLTWHSLWRRYSVLGIKVGSTKSEISAAYHKQIVKYHPDLQVGKTEAEKQRALERTKLINDAYRKLKSQRK